MKEQLYLQKLIQELNNCPHIQLTSSLPWIPSKVKFPCSATSLEEEVGGMRYLSGIKTHHEIECFLREEEDPCFCLESMNRVIASMKVVVDEEKMASLGSSGIAE